MKKKNRKLNLFDLISMGVGIVIGAGIFSMLMTGISLTGRSITVALVGAMILTILQQIRPIFMASMFALGGGIYSQGALILPPLFTGGTVIIYVISSFTLSIYGIAVSQYLVQLIPILAPYQILISVSILTVFFLITVRGISSSAIIQNIMAICMYAALVLLIIFGFVKNGASEAAATPYMAGGHLGFLMAVAIMSYTCVGAQNLINLADETQNPKRNIPLGILLSSAVAVFLYALLGHVAAKFIPYNQTAGTTLGSVAEMIMPKGLYLFFVIGGAIFALTTTLLGTISAISQPIVAGAEDGWLPKVMTKRTKSGYPWVVMLMMYLLAVVPALFNSTLDTIVSFILVPSMFFNVVCICLSFRLPKKFPETWQNCGLHCPYWLYCVLMVLSIIASLITAIFSMAGLDLTGIIGNIVLTVFLFAFSYWRLKTGKVKFSSIEKVKAESK